MAAAPADPMTTKCDHCPIADGPCLVRMCDKAARGVASDMAQIRAINARRTEPKPPTPVVASGPKPGAVKAARILLTTIKTRMGRACLYSSRAACGCSGLAYCHALGRDASVRDCTACLKEMS